MYDLQQNKGLPDAPAYLHKPPVSMHADLDDLQSLITPFL